MSPVEAIGCKRYRDTAFTGRWRRTDSPDVALYFADRGHDQRYTQQVRIVTGFSSRKPGLWLVTYWRRREKVKNAVITGAGLSKVRWTTRASGFHAVRPLIKLMDGTFLVGDHAEASTTTFLESEFAFAGLRWIRLDIDRIVTVGRYGPLGEASSWAESPDLTKVDEVGFVDLMPGSGHGSGGYVNVGAFELYATPVKRSERK